MRCRSKRAAPNAGGDVIDLVRYQERLTEGKRDADRRTAALLIADWFGIESERGAGDARARTRK